MHSPENTPSRWERLGSRSLAKTRIFDLDEIKFRHPVRQTERDFVVLNPPDWVNVIALTSDHQIVLVKQFRYGLDDFALEIPGGVIDPGEDFMAAGIRELREETGYEGSHAQLLGTVDPNPAFQRNRSHLIMVTDAKCTAEIAWDPDEEIEISLLPVDEVLALARNGGITHSLVLNALFMFEPWWRELKGRGV
ncbi:MAG: NUDIX hydrolase [Opitutaceae bacterium]|jgi:ADP-ribose pyrophosphatase|nr:NUDIX hydrolase [Opitutaceae bacterium]|tara:strand:- start:8277 stop:8855 length:579 start_codon:yes stop_codon:yes gene_type:complete